MKTSIGVWMPKAAFCVSVKYLSPAVLICLCVMEVYRVICSPLAYPAWVTFAFGAGLSLLTVTAGIWLSFSSKRGVTLPVIARSVATKQSRRAKRKNPLNPAIFGRFWRKRVKK